jgi:NADH-quinone oxidoreductase subunit K
MLPLTWLIIFSLVLFAIGVFGVVARRNLIFILISIEIMLNAVALLFVAGAGIHQGADGQVIYLLILALAAAEVAIGLALVITMFRSVHSLDVDVLMKMRG